MRAKVRVDIVHHNIPLLLSLDSLKRGGVDCLNFVDGTVNILGQKLNLKLSKSGHYLLPLNADMASGNQSTLKEDSLQVDGNCLAPKVVLNCYEVKRLDGKLPLKNKVEHHMCNQTRSSA